MAVKLPQQSRASLTWVMVGVGSALNIGGACPIGAWNCRIHDFVIKLSVVAAIGHSRTCCATPTGAKQSAEASYRLAADRRESQLEWLWGGDAASLVPHVDPKLSVKGFIPTAVCSFPLGKCTLTLTFRHVLSDKGGVMFCTQCGARSTSTAAFCSKCGSPLAKEPLVNAPASAPPTSLAGEPKGTTTSLWLIGAFAVVVVLAVVVMVAADPGDRGLIVATLTGGVARSVLIIIAIFVFYLWWEFFKQGGRHAALASSALVLVTLLLGYVLFLAGKV